MSLDSKSKFTASKVVSAASSEASCYFRLGFDEWFNDDIFCTPIQEFYVPKEKKWVPAFKLKIGDELLSGCKKTQVITHMEFVKKPIKTYMLQVEPHHTFMVGRHCIVTHNMALPLVGRIGIEMAFEGAAAGGAAGSYFGPVTIVGGVVIGGVIGFGYWAATKDTKPEFKTHLDADAFGQQWENASRKEQDKGSKQEKPQNKPDDNENPERKGQGTQPKPGVPGEETGFKPPKNWNGEKVKHPGQYGYPHKNGNI